MNTSLTFLCSYSEALKSSHHYSGQGVATYPNGDTYDGNFADGSRCGQGTYTVAASGGDGEEDVKDTYKGEWLDNEKNGIGKQTYFGVGDYNGYWASGSRQGEGVMIYANQDIYSGLWKNGQKDGQGTYVFKETGMKYVGHFKSGQLVQGKWKYPNGTYFEGNFDNNQPKGKGSWHFANGNNVGGEYNQIRRADVEEDN